MRSISTLSHRLIPRTRTLLATLVLTTAGLAGCLSGVDTDDAAGDATDAVTDDPSASRELAWGFTECTWIVAAVPTDAASLEEHFPEGFTPMTPEEMGLPPQPHADAIMGLEAFDCARGAGLNGPVEPMIYSAYWSPAHPPEDLAREGALLQFVKWDVLVPDEERRTFLLDAGIPAVDGAVDLSGFQATPAGNAFSVAFTIGEDAHAFHGVANGPGSEEMKNFTAREFTVTPSGIAVWDTRVVSPTLMQGTGTVELAAGSFPAEVVGAEQAQAFFLSGTKASFVDGALRLPGTEPTS